LEHAAQRIRESRCYGKDIDHRLVANLMVVVTRHAGDSQLALRSYLAREERLSRMILVQTGAAHRIATLPGAFPQ
jgi:hypothetical protein